MDTCLIDGRAAGLVTDYQVWEWMNNSMRDTFPRVHRSFFTRDATGCSEFTCAILCGNLCKPCQKPDRQGGHLSKRRPHRSRF